MQFWSLLSCATNGMLLQLIVVEPIAGLGFVSVRTWLNRVNVAAGAGFGVNRMVGFFSPAYWLGKVLKSVLHQIGPSYTQYKDKTRRSIYHGSS